MHPSIADERRAIYKIASLTTMIELQDKMTAKLEKIEGSINSLKDSLKSIEDEQSAIDNFSWNTFLSNAEHAGQRMAEIGKGMTLAITIPFALFGKKMYDNAVDYESAFVGMRKTNSEATTEQLEKWRDLALEWSESFSPTSFEEYMGIAQTGGNLGVAVDNMEAFMKTYSALQYATDKHISGDAGAQLVADFLNIIDGGVQNIERFGSTIVYLGNHYNALEDQILEMSKRMAAAASLAGISTPKILGMATAFRSVGINPEAGGSAASKLIKQFQLAAEVGGNAQERLAGLGEMYNFDNGLDFKNWLGVLAKDDWYSLADDLQMTRDAIENMADSWL